MEKINIAELLKDCPQGMELDCTMYDNVVLEFVANVKEDTYPIKLKTKHGTPISVTEYGCYDMCADAKCVIFPKDKTTWEGFHRPFKDGDIVFYSDTIAIFKEWGDETLFRAHAYTYLGYEEYLCKEKPIFGKGIRKEVRFATEEEKAKFFDIIKANGYKWDEETKTLEKLIPNKFDINTLVPFESRVLVRAESGNLWKPAIFGCYVEDKYAPYYVLGGTCWSQCIPYEGNEHLSGKVDDCAEYFKTWK